MMHPRNLKHLLIPLFLSALTACGGGSSNTPTAKSAEPVAPPTPTPTPTPAVSYDVRAAVLQLYGKQHSWNLKGIPCCTGGTMSASLSLQPRPLDNGSFNIGGENLTGVDITLLLTYTDALASSTTQHLWYTSKGQQMMANGLSDTRIEMTTSQGSLSTSAVPGDSGSNGETSTYAQYPSAPVLASTTSYRWELKKDDATRVLLCLNSVETPDALFAGNNPALAAKTISSYCYGLNADSSLSGYVSISKHGFAGMGYELSTQ